MKTKLYLPIIGLTINDVEGEKIIQSGPAYTLVIHESPTWLKIKDEISDPELIEIITEKKAQEYIEIVNRFFAPIHESAPYYYSDNGEKWPSENLTLNLRRALSYILIGYDYKARIYESDIRIYSTLSNRLKEYEDIFSEEAINRVMFIENLLSGYQMNSVNTLSINKDERIFNDLLYLLDNEKIKLLSEKNHLFGVLDTRKDILKRELREVINVILREELLPYIVQAPTLLLFYYTSQPQIIPILTLLSGLGAKILKNYKFKDFIPPIQNHRLFWFGQTSGSFLYTWFNYSFKWYIRN